MISDKDRSVVLLFVKSIVVIDFAGHLTSVLTQNIKNLRTDVNLLSMNLVNKHSHSRTFFHMKTHVDHRRKLLL